MDRVSQKFINRINSTKDLKSLQTELDSLERNANSQYMWNSKEVHQKMGLIKDRIEVLTTKSIS